MVEVRNRKLADMEVPVGMTGPLHVERLAVIEGESNVAPNDLVDDRPVVNAMHGDEAAVITAKEFREASRLRDSHQVCDVDDRDAQLFCGNQEIGKRFLVEGIYLGENNVLWFVPTQHYLGIQLPEAGFGVAAQEPVQRFVEIVNLSIGRGEHGL